MKKLLVISLVALSSVAQAAEWYKVTVTRKDNNIYRTAMGTIIITNYCWEYAFMEEAILKIDSFDSKLIFENGEVCDVEKVID